MPRLYDELEAIWVERYVPEQLRTRRLLFIPLYQWIEGLLGLPLILGLASILTRILTAFLRPLLRRLTHEQDDRRLASIVWPLRLEVLALLIYWTSRYAASLLVRRFWGYVAATLGVIAVTWLLMRLGDVITELLTWRLARVNRSVDIMLVRLINRLGKAVLATVCALLLLRLSGFDLTAVLTGLGLGGVAIAFAAQKTLENLFGGIMVISDKPIQVGDFCRAGEFQGVVEDIGLRSTRLRTLERTVVSIPNGQLATMSLENFTLRDRIRFRHMIGLRYETTADQLRYVLAEIRQLLYKHSKVDSTDARVRFVGFASSSLDVEVLAYVLVTDYCRVSGDSGGPAAANYGHYRSQWNLGSFSVADDLHGWRLRTQSCQKSRGHREGPDIGESTATCHFRISQSRESRSSTARLSTLLPGSAVKSKNAKAASTEQP